MSRRSFWIAALLATVSAASASAQWYHRPHRAGYGVGLGLGWGGIYAPNLGSTPAESYARGMADTMRAQGEAYQNIARGMVDYEQARSAYIQNQKQWQQTAMEREQLGLQRRQQYYAAQRASRQRYEAMAEATPPPRLSTEQYDRATGLVKWPEVLQSPDYADARKKIEELLVLKAHTGNTSAVNQKVYEGAKALQNDLKNHIRDLPPHGYIEARKFLDYLAQEARSAA